MNQSITLALAGACCTRDAFNSRFVPDYKDHFTLLSYEFQPSLISLMDAPRFIAASLFDSTGASEVEDSFHTQLRSELSKNFLIDIVRAQPEFFLIDFYADVFWGIIKRREGGYLTARSIFTHSDSAECRGQALRPDTQESEYFELFHDTAERFGAFASSWLPGTHIAINGARFSESYTDAATGAHMSFRDSHPAPAKERNHIWESFDSCAAAAWGASRLRYRATYELDPSYPFGGLAEVHYVPEYYVELSRQLRSLAYEWRAGSDYPAAREARRELHARCEAMSDEELRDQLWPGGSRAPSTAEILATASDPYRLGISEVTPSSPLARGWLRDAFRSLKSRHSTT